MPTRRHSSPVPQRTTRGYAARLVAAERALQAYRRIIDALHHIATLALREQPLPAVLQEVVEEVSAITGFPMVAIELYDPAGQCMEFAAATGMPYSPGQDRLRVPVAQTLSGLVVQCGQVLVEAHTQERPEYVAAELRQLGVETFVCLPLIVTGQVLGTLSLAHPEAISLDTDLVPLAQSLTHVIATLIVRSRAEERSQATEQQLHRILDTLPAGVLMIDADGYFHFANKRAAAMFGQTPTAVVGKSLFDLLPQEVAQAYLERHRRFIATQEAAEYEATFDLPGGARTFFVVDQVIADVQDTRALFLSSSIDMTARKRAELELQVAMTAEPRRYTEGAVVGVTMATIDITAWRTAEAALRASEARFRTLADAVPQLIWANDADGKAIYFNQRWYDYSGLTDTESAGPGWSAIVHADDAPAATERWQQAFAAGTVFDTEYRLHRADGVYRWHLGRSVPLRNADGQIIGWFGSATDIEALKQAEAARRESTVLRRLAAAQEEERLRIARDLHDQLGQQITGLLLGLKELEGHMANADAFATLASLQALALELARESHRIAVNLRPTALEDVGLVPALEQLVADWRRQTGIRAAFESLGWAQDRLPRPVEVALFRVVQEALTNIQKHAGATNVGVIIERCGDQVIVVVEDNGCGFPAEGPPVDGGHPQLGLLGMRERVAQVSGTLEIESSPAIGTTVFVRVPL